MKKAIKRILFLDHTPFVGGAQLSLIQHLGEIDRSKFEPMVAHSVGADPHLLSEYGRLGIKNFPLTFERLKVKSPAALMRFYESVSGLARLIKKERVDLVVSITVRTSIVGSIAAFACRIPSLWLIRDFTFNRFLFYPLKTFPRRIVFNSRAVARYYCRKYENNKKMSVVYVGRDFYKKAARVTPEEVADQRKSWQADDGDFVVGYVGRLVGWKGPQVLIRAVKILIEEGFKNIRCIIVGTGKGQMGNNEEKLKTLVEQNRLSDNVIFMGQQKDVALIMKSLDVLALTSIEPEPFSSTVIDAMMAGVPVIGTAIGGTPEIIIDKETGLLVAPGDHRKLAGAIKKISADRPLRRSIADKAYARAMRNNTAEAISRRLERVYLEA